MEVSIHELLAAAREAVKSDYIKGESILCETRYHPDTRYMVEIEMLKTDNTLGEKGEYMRKFLTEDEYSSMLQEAGRTSHKNKKTGHCSKRNIAIYPSPGQAGQPPEEGIVLTGWERTGSVPQAAAV